MEKPEPELIEISEVVIKEATAEFVNIWFRAYRDGEWPTLSCFVQPASKPKTVTSLTFSLEASQRLSAILRAKIKKDSASEAWSSITINIGPSGIQKVDYANDNLKKKFVFEVGQQWMKQNLSHLKFIPDKR